MKTHFAFLAVALLLTASFGVLLGDESDLQVIAAPPQVAPDDYHNSTIKFNIDLPGGGPAAGFSVEVVNSRSPYRYDHGYTDSAGYLELTINFMTMGLCQYHVYDLNKTSVYYEELEIWPDEVLYRNITVNNPLPSVNRIHGVVKNATSGLPIAGVLVTVTGSDLNGEWLRVTNTTDSAGRYEVNVPNSTKSYSISFNKDDEFYSDTFYLFLEMDVLDYTRDYYLKPFYRFSQPAHIRINDTTTGDHWTLGELHISGHVESIDDSTISTIMVNGDKDTGWFNTTLEPGCYEAFFRSVHLSKDPYLYLRDFFYVNDTELFHELQVALPQYIELEVDVWNSTTPLQSAYVSWADITDRSTIGCFHYTGTTGKAYLKVPTDRVVDLQISYSGYTSKTVKLDPSGHSSTIKMNVTLEKVPVLVNKQANITVRVVDDVTGIGISFAYVNLVKYSENSGYFNGYYANSTGVLKRTIDLTANNEVFTKIDLTSGNHFGYGGVRGIKIEEGEDKQIVIRTMRYKLQPEDIRTHFFVKDPGGTPLPGLRLQVSMITDLGGSSVDVLTDSNGRAEVMGPPGEYMFNIYSSPRYYRPFWKMSGQRIIVKEPGLIGDLTAYPAHPLDTYWGFVRDSETSEVLPYVYVESYSVKKLERTRNGVPPGDPNEISLFSMYSGTDNGGYYRTKGTSTKELTFLKEGYFNKKLEIGPGTRATQIEDIFLEPITESVLWVNGTIVDENREPVVGYVSVFDSDHDDHQVTIETVNGTGRFSIHLYPGNFTFSYTDYTTYGTMDVTVGTASIDNLELMLIPISEVLGVVKDWSGEPLEGVNVTLVNIDINEPGFWVLTDEFGQFSFDIVRGNYSLYIERTELYDEYVVDTFEMNGWDNEYFEITLANRSMADIFGSVFGEAGPLVSGVPEALIILMHDGMELMNTTADSGGYFEFIDIDHGTNYSIEAAPPEEWQPVMGTKSGYLMNSTMNINVSGAAIEVDIMLPFMEYAPPGWMDFVDHMPVGDNVSLDEDIIVKFSRPVNISTFIEAFYIEPALDVNFTLNDDGDTVIMTHGPLQPNTTYTVMIDGSVFSIDGWPLMNYEGMEWNFTTSDQMSSWKIHSVDVDVGDDKNVTIIVNGVDDMTLYIVIDGLGSYQIMPSGFPGRYSLTIDGEDLEWNTMYFYHFSDQADGEDLAIGFSGNFTTPTEPGTEWDLISSMVTAEDNGSISVEVTGTSGHSVWINIVGVGWYELIEGEEGEYSVSILAEDLDWDTEYSYFYSDRENGPDLEPGLSGTVRTVASSVVVDDDDDDDDTQTSTFGKISVWMLSCCGIVLLLIFLILIIVLVSKRRSKDEGFEE